VDALEPFRLSLPKQDPEPLPYLREPAGIFSYDIELDVFLKTNKMTEGTLLAKTNMKHLYWSPCQ